MSAHAEQPAHIPPEVSKMRQLERREAEVLYRWFAGDTVAQPGLHKSAAPLPPGAVRDSRLHVMERSGFRLIKPLCWDSLGDPAPQGAHEDDDWGLSFEDDGGQPTEHDIDWYLEWFWGSIARMDHTRVPFPRKAPAAAKACDADREFAGHALRHALPARWFCFRLVHDGAPGCVPRSPSEQKLWYYNFTTGESVWEPPHGLQEHAEAYERLHRFTKLRQAAEGPHLRRGSAAAGAAAAFAPDAAAVAAGQGGGLLSGHAGVSRQPSPEPLQGHGPAAAQHGHRPPPAARGGHSPHGSLTAEERHEELLRTGYGPGPEFYADPAASGGQPERRTRGATAAPDDAQHVDGAPADGTAGEEELGETESGVPGDYIRNIGIGVAVCASVGAGVGCFTATCILNHGTAGLGAAMGALTGTPLGVGAGVFVTKHDELYPPEGTEGGAAVRGQGEGPTLRRVLAALAPLVLGSLEQMNERDASQAIYGLMGQGADLVSTGIYDGLLRCLLAEARAGRLTAHSAAQASQSILTLNSRGVGDAKSAAELLRHCGRATDPVGDTALRQQLSLAGCPLPPEGNRIKTPQGASPEWCMPERVLRLILERGGVPGIRYNVKHVSGFELDIVAGRVNVEIETSTRTYLSEGKKGSRALRKNLLETRYGLSVRIVTVDTTQPLTYPVEAIARHCQGPLRPRRAWRRAVKLAERGWKWAIHEAMRVFDAQRAGAPSEHSRWT
eukprot:TRINITY_DN20794_c0_g1_i1.p1 TRINITY_DN20794_c0_g1~~TRINITY_DN20794_c0_g1_i1.p1  ORF type:complete len:760 (+),score=182.83 TRINITY_DN20794_c0_g1_i1:102-2282(+)